MNVPRSGGGAAAAVALVAVLLAGCATERVARGGGQPPGPAARPRAGTGTCCRPASATALQRAVARTAAAFVGARRIEVGGRRLPFDCSGLARGVYLTHGVDLYEGVETDETANGVRLIHRYVSRHGRLRRKADPRPGDLVFFHNTWDRDGDGRLNDLLTHVGIVERVERDGTVVFVSRVSRGVRRYRMNLEAPGRHRARSGRVLNDFMRRKRPGDPPAARYLTGELFASFGTLGK